MFESLELQIARTKIERYEHHADEPLIHTSKVAQDCMDCEAYLEQGIAALAWLERYEQVAVEAAVKGFVESSPDLDQTIASLYAAWLRPCEFAEKWIASCQRNGYEVRNVVEFRDGCSRVEEWLERNEHYRRSQAARDERFAEEPW